MIMNGLKMNESGVVSYIETTPDSFVQKRQKLYYVDWLNLGFCQWNDIRMGRNGLGMNESGVVSSIETTPDSFILTSFSPLLSHLNNSVSFQH